MEVSTMRRTRLDEAVLEQPATVDPTTLMSQDEKDARIAALEARIAEMNAENAVHVPAVAPKAETPLRKLYYLDGPWHCCGRTSPHTMFVPSEADYRPHAMVTQSFGDHLIAIERRADGRPRYEWAVD